MSNVRAFLSLDIPEQVCDKLNAFVNSLRSPLDGISWVPHDHYHVTVCFFGETDEGLLLGPMSETIEMILRRHRVMNIECVGVGVFPNWKYPKVIWAGLGGDCEELLNLHHGLTVAMRESSVGEDVREFRPHLTIGRAKAIKDEAIIRKIESLGPISFGEFKVEHLTLYKSVLTKKETVYTPLRSFEFNRKE